MKTAHWNLSVFLTAIALATFANTIPLASAVELDYHFDFNDDVLPDVLTVTQFHSESYSHPTCEVADGHLRIFDQYPAYCGASVSPNLTLPDQFTTDTHISAICNADGGSLGGIHFFTARATGRWYEAGADWYECYVWPNEYDDSIVHLSLKKVVDQNEVAKLMGADFQVEGPFRVEFDVTDGRTTEGIEYTDLTARLIFDDGQETEMLSVRDWGTWGGRERLLSGFTAVGASITPSHRNMGWVLDATYDDLTIRGTLVPEPSILLLVALGAAFAVWRRRKS